MKWQQAHEKAHSVLQEMQMKIKMSYCCIPTIMEKMINNVG